MIFNCNGQVIIFFSELQEKGVIDFGGLKWLIDCSVLGSYIFVYIFFIGIYVMWFYYWLVSVGIDFFNDVCIVVVLLLQMVMNMCIGNMSGFCVGELWNVCVINDCIGFIVVIFQDIWFEYLEKVLGICCDWVECNLNIVCVLVVVLMEVQCWIVVLLENIWEMVCLFVRCGWFNIKE